MKRGVKLSLLVLIIVVGSVLLLGFIGFSCQLWTHVALSGAKKVGTKILLRALNHSAVFDLPIDRFPILARFLRPGL